MYKMSLDFIEPDIAGVRKDKFICKGVSYDPRIIIKNPKIVAIYRHYYTFIANELIDEQNNARGTFHISQNNFLWLLKEGYLFKEEHFIGEFFLVKIHTSTWLIPVGHELDLEITGASAVNKAILQVGKKYKVSIHLKYYDGLGSDIVFNGIRSAIAVYDLRCNEYIDKCKKESNIDDEEVSFIKRFVKRNIVELIYLGTITEGVRIIINKNKNNSFKVTLKEGFGARFYGSFNKKHLFLCPKTGNTIAVRRGMFNLAEDLGYDNLESQKPLELVSGNWFKDIVKKYISKNITNDKTKTDEIRMFSPNGVAFNDLMERWQVFTFEELKKELLEVDIAFNVDLEDKEWMQTANN